MLGDFAVDNCYARKSKDKLSGIKSEPELVLTAAQGSAALVGFAEEPLAVKVGSQFELSSVQLVVFKLNFEKLFISPISTKLI